MRITNTQLPEWAQQRNELRVARELVDHLLSMSPKMRRAWVVSPQSKLTEVVKAFSIVFPDATEADAKLAAFLR